MKILVFISIFVGLNLLALEHKNKEVTNEVYYQLFVRNFTALDNSRAGVGTFDKISEKIIYSLKDLGVTTIWLTGVMEHASLTTDDPDVVKGNAGSPYAIRDYFDVQKELGSKDDFIKLIERIHKANLKVIIDLVANHTARKVNFDVPNTKQYEFGSNLNDKNYYYLDGEFQLPKWPEKLKVPGYKYDGIFSENPAKATGNDVFKKNPTFNDWFETAKLNYNSSDTWRKMSAVINYWLKLGVDGFRCDVAEMVPLEFWSFAISEARKINPNAIFLMEAYEYESPLKYSHEGMFRVGATTIYAQNFYDIAKNYYQKGFENLWAIDIGKTVDWLLSRNSKFTFYIENHDQIRSTSKQFVGGGLTPSSQYGFAISKYLAALPADILIYNGQELGETGNGFSGFAEDTGRTTIFDYYSLSSVKNFYNEGSSPKSIDLRNEYKNILNFHSTDLVKYGQYISLNDINDGEYTYSKFVSSYLRIHNGKKLLVVANFDPVNSHDITIHLTKNSNDSHGVLNSLQIENSNTRFWCFEDANRISGSVLHSPSGIPSGIYLRNISPLTVKYFYIEECL